ncbi:HD domain-containing protein [Candidatus Woesebacteria bacterium]|nr:HD domain-containing protein [Candidatus Woesebacteria bacterium]
MNKPTPTPGADIEIHVPVKNNALLTKALDMVNTNEEIRTLWRIVNTNAIERLRMTDHGPVHFQIVSNLSLRLLRILVKKGIAPSIVKDFQLTNDHAELVLLLASLLHDIGMSANREGHEEFSLFMTHTLLRELIDFLPIDEKTIVIAETMHAIINHRSGGRPSTIEGGILRVADALDMSEGRSRIPFEEGYMEIHTVSALAIDNVTVSEGKDLPILIDVYMNSSAGIFQTDQLLRSKLKNSGIEQYIQVIAHIKDRKGVPLTTDFEL